MNPNLQNKLDDVVRMVTTLIALVVAAADQRIRPVLDNFRRIALALGVSTARLIRQLFDRHLVAFVLRPVLSFSLVVVVTAFALGWYAIYKIDVPLGEPGIWLAAFTALVIVVGAFVRVQAVGVRGLVDGDIRELRARHPLLVAQDAMNDQLRDTDRQVFEALQAGYRRAVVEWQQAAVVAAQAGTAFNVAPPQRPSTPAPTVMPAAQQLTQAERDTVQAWLATEVAQRFGRAGLVPRIATTTLLLWVCTGAWFIVAGFVLEYYRAAYALSSVFVGFGWIMVAVAMLLWVVGAMLSAALIKRGLGGVVWGARLFLRPILTEAFLGVDNNNVDLILAKNLGVPSDEMAKEIGEAHQVPFAILCALAMLSTIEHSIDYLGFLGGLAIVLLFGWGFVTWMKQEISKKVVHGFVVGIFILGLYQLLRRMMGGSVVADFAFAHSALYVFGGASSYALTMIVCVIAAFVFVTSLAVYFLSHNFGSGTLQQFAIGAIFLVLASIAMIISYRIAVGHQAHEASARADSSEAAGPVHAPHSASSGTTFWYPPTI